MEGSEGFHKLFETTGSTPVRSIRRNFLLLFSGTLFSRLAALAAMPLVARIYTPEDLGELAVFVAAVTFVSPMLSLRLPTIVPVIRSDSTALNLISLSAVLIVIGAALAAALIFTADLVGVKSRTAEIVVSFPVLFLAACCAAAIWELAIQWSTRQSKFGNISADHIIGASSETLLKLLLPTLGVQHGALLVAYIAGHGVTAWKSIRLLVKDIKLGRTSIRLTRMVACLRLFKSVPIWRLPSQLILVLSAQAPILVFAEIFGFASSGQLSMAFLIVNAPVSLVGAAAGQAYLAELRLIGRNSPKDIVRITRQFMVLLAGVALLPAAALFFFGGFLFAWIFGEEWRTAGQFASALSPVLLAQFVAVPIPHLLTLYGQHRRFLLLNATRLAIILSAVALIIALDLQPVQALVVLSVSLAVHYVASSSSVFLSVVRKSSG